MPYRKTKARLEHAEAVRASLIAAGLRLLREGGVEAVTVRGVVVGAQSSVGKYYHHFAGKDELLLAMAERVMEKQTEKIDAIAALPPASSDSQEPPDEDRLAAALTRVAVMVTVGTYIALDDPAVSALTRASGLGENVRGMIHDRFLERTRLQFSRPEFAPLVDDPALTAIFWQGSILLLLERVIAGDIGGTPDLRRLAIQTATWNLRALGVPADLREPALLAAEQALPS